MLRSLAAPTARARVSFRNSSRMTYSSIPSWASVDPKAMGSTPDVYAVSNLIDGKWVQAKGTLSFPDPMNKDAHPIFTCPDTTVEEIQPFLDSLRKVPKSGVHNPLKNPARYVEYGEISRRVSFLLYSCWSWRESRGFILVYSNRELDSLVSFLSALSSSILISFLSRIFKKYTRLATNSPNPMLPSFLPKQSSSASPSPKHKPWAKSR